MLRIRSCSSAIASRTRSWFSASCAVAATSCTIAGCAVCSGPVMSIAPMIVPVSGSCTGAAAQVQAWTVRTRCSAEWIDTGASTASAVPIAFVPMASSDQRMPGASPTASAAAQQAARALAPEDRAVRVGDDHDVHGLVRDAHQRAAQQGEHGAERVRGAHARPGRRPGRSTGATCRSGSTRAARLRRHDSETSDRGARAGGAGEHAS